ncbi:hypothetical protein DKX38_003723 [Salix brachista]|uniref:Cytochrome P450 n=1 Tax=Salix brachista TaxID=2182728 RepID=A0A5N5N937_9ROSI|nr:hypothetical protein DKX38_003723 [Salix brachista]
MSSSPLQIPITHNSLDSPPHPTPDINSSPNQDLPIHPTPSTIPPIIDSPAPVEQSHVPRIVTRSQTGHLYLLKQPVHRAFHSLSKKHGPIFSIKLGSRLAVVISSPSAVEECFTKNDIVLANRPHFLSSKYLYYNSTTMGSVGYGQHWRNLRRISALEIFSPSRLTSLFSIRREEVMVLVRRLHSVSKHGNYTKVELRSMLFDLTCNIIMRMVAGERYYGEDVKEIEEARVFKEIMEEYAECVAVRNLGDLIPLLQWIDFTGHLKKLDRLGKKMDEFLQGVIDEHRDDHRDRNTMINRFLALQEEQPEYYTDEIIKGHVLCFEWERVGGDKIDMAEKTAMTMTKVEPLELMCRARPILHVILS